MSSRHGISCALAALLTGFSIDGWAQHNTVPPASPCARAAQTSYPHAYISNGLMDAVVYLPDAEKGSYRSSRFDWSGIVACASYKGHTYFGLWSNATDPMGNDTVTGPAEEFRRSTSEIGYDDAKPGDSFLKVGVGVLKRLDDKPYSFGTVYPVVDHGAWKVKVSKSSITFSQTLHTAFGYSYEYRKTLRLDSTKPTLVLEHTLKNKGSKAIETNVYDHDFFVLDAKPTGPGMSVTFGFEPKLDHTAPETLATVSGNELVFKDTPHRGYSVQGYFTGFTGKPGEYSFHVQDRESGVGVLQTSDSPLSNMYFWSTPTTICPEGYIAVNVAPGKVQDWKISYSFESR
jgi:hypothetical protein